MKKTIVNLVSGPGVGKSLYSAILFSLIKMRGYNSEYVQEYAKDLAWNNKKELLRNQHHITYHQYKSLKGAAKHVDLVITDGSLIHSYYYNRHNKPNYSNVELTEQRIDKYLKKFHNIVIFLKRNPKYPYEQKGRYQSEEEAKAIDDIMKGILDEKGIKYIEVEADLENVNEMLDYIEREYQTKVYDIDFSKNKTRNELLNSSVFMGISLYSDLIEKDTLLLDNKKLNSNILEIIEKNVDLSKKEVKEIIKWIFKNYESLEFDGSKLYKKKNKIFIKNKKRKEKNEKNIGSIIINSL